MATIRYQFSDGHFEIIEVTEEFTEKFNELEKDCKREEWRNQWRQRKCLSSLEDMQELGCQFRDASLTPEELLIERAERRNMHAVLKKALTSLLPKQRILIKQIYIENKSLKEIANDLGITYQAIQNRLTKILRKLRKLFD